MNAEEGGRRYEFSGNQRRTGYKPVLQLRSK